MSPIENAQILLYCHLDNIIKGPGTSFQASALSHAILCVTFIMQPNLWISQKHETQDISRTKRFLLK